MITDAKADVTRLLIDHFAARIVINSDACLSVSRETAVAEEKRYDQNAQMQCT